MQKCQRCGHAVYGQAVLAGGRTENLLRVGATTFCTRCAGEEIDRLRADLANYRDAATIESQQACYKSREP